MCPCLRLLMFHFQTWIQFHYTHKLKRDLCDKTDRLVRSVVSAARKPSYEHSFDTGISHTLCNFAFVARAVVDRRVRTS